MPELHEQASNKILDSLNDAMTEGLLPDHTGQGVVLSYVAVIEILNSEGKSKVVTLWNDDRCTVLLGLLNYGQIAIQGGMGGEKSI